MVKFAGVLIAAFAVLLAIPIDATAAPPDNNDRADAQTITLPANVTGTTAESTRENNEPFERCQTGSGGTVWYSFAATANQRVVVDLAAQGNLDAAVSVYHVRRSQLDQLDCEATDDNGAASVAFQAASGQTYLIQVSQRSNSAAGTFRLTANAVQPAATPPGKTLPGNGAANGVNRTLNPSDAWSVVLREGVTYRFNLSGSSNVNVELFPPGTRSFSSGDSIFDERGPVYFVFTPGDGESGRYPMRVSTNTRGTSNYRLTVAVATQDDTTPGRPLFNFDAARGSLNGGKIDVIDLYRFDIRRRSDLTLDLRTKGQFDMELRSEKGSRLRCACDDDGNTELRTTIARGRYFVALIARGNSRADYKLTRITRAITRTGLRLSRRSVQPGGIVNLTAVISSGASGTTLIGVERFDPLFGWQFFARYRVRATDGRASVAFRTPYQARFRARARFLGSRAFSPSQSGFRGFAAETPIGT
jgi:Bacterial pre-peptidase C-terminal domain